MSSAELTDTAVLENAWPPRSPHAALLSSPSGRRKYEQSQSCREHSLSPAKRSTNLPGLQRASRKLFDDDEDANEVDNLEDDEETLELKLAAIEAKLKLKKLQQNREKSQGKGAEAGWQNSNKVQSSTSRTFVSKSSYEDYGSGTKSVEVPVSPTRRTISHTEQRSPGRVLLGIDKGMKGTDISLRRAKSVREKGARAENSIRNGTRDGTSHAPRSELFQETRSKHKFEHPVKTFSERMAEDRALEQKQGKRREALVNKRGLGFKLNTAEMETFKKAAAEARAHDPPRSPLKDRERATFSREDVLRSQRGSVRDSGTLKRSSTLPSLRGHRTDCNTSVAEKSRSSAGTATAEFQISDAGQMSERATLREQGDSALYDSFSQLHLSSRVLPHSFLQRTFPSETHTCLSLSQLLKQVKAPAYELPDLEARDVVILGVIASKSSPLDHKRGQGVKHAVKEKSRGGQEANWDDGSQNQKRFMVLQLSDLTWSVDLYLFGTALPKYHRLSAGTVVAILNPGIMPPKKGREDTGAFSLTLHHGEDTLLEIGTARDLGFCAAIKKDGQQCASWVNLIKTEVCEWHLNAQVTKTQAGRMGVNTGSNAIGRDVDKSRLRNRLVAGVRGGRGSHRGTWTRTHGHGFDADSQSRYFSTPSSESQRTTNCAGNGEFFQRSAASLMELDDNDPFIAEGRLSRDTESRLKKSLLNEEKERDIARKLTSTGTGGAGGEYLRHRIASNLDGSNLTDSTSDERGEKKTLIVTKDDILKSGRNTNGKRAADSVRLSPMKKTRFLTEKGVRKAGRESLGARLSDQEDGLDII